MKRMMQAMLLMCVWWGTSVVAAEETPTKHEMELSLGARIGGYGFREVKDAKVNWDDCRMDGFGLFGALDLTRNLYLETSFEMYHATGKSVALGMDRTSFHTHLTGGARFFREFLIVPSIHAGLGPEYTQITVGEAQRSMFLFNGFAGLGGELNLGRVKLGTHARWLWSGLPEHGHLHAQGEVHQHLESGQGGGDEVVVNYQTGGQMQFWVRYVF